MRLCAWTDLAAPYLLFMNPLFFAYEPTSDDVMTVLAAYGKNVSFEEAERLFDAHILGDEDMPKAALESGDDLDSQTEGANQMIARILFDAGELPGAFLCGVCGKVRSRADFPGGEQVCCGN